jgi:hypothetical protein
MANDQREHEAYEDLCASRDQINHLSLGESILEQPQLFGHCASWCAHVIARRDAFKDNIQDVEAAVQLRVRNEIAEAGEKATEGKVEAMVRVSPEVKEARKRWHKAKEVADRWTYLLDSYKQRSYSLTQYVNWRAGDYVDEKMGHTPTVSRESLSRRMRQ